MLPYNKKPSPRIEEGEKTIVLVRPKSVVYLLSRGQMIDCHMMMVVRTTRQDQRKVAHWLQLKSLAYAKVAVNVAGYRYSALLRDEGILSP